MKAAARRSGLLARLARDNSGNAMMVMAAALIPLMGMIGSGLDISRAYLVKSKMQTACDAAALGARRAMASTTLDQAAIDEGEKFFHFNFPPGTMESAPVDLDIKANATDVSTVDVTASTTVPTTIMKLFGIETLDASVECSADQDYINNDIMLVLDVTGSMNCKAGTSCNYAATEQSNSRLSRLRDAAAALYKTLEGAKGVRTRYGFMPYSMTVNVGPHLNHSWLRNPATYPNCTQFKQDGSCKIWGTPFSKNRNANWFSNTWGGCVEERSTISQNHQSKILVSADVAQDDIDTVSTSDAKLQWQPYDPDATNAEAGAYANLKSFCPAPAKKLDEYDSESDFQDAVDESLAKVGGYTNHDLGIMWGMRLLSGTGIRATENPDTFQQVPVARHIIFLTDGVMTADNNNYSAFGIPSAERRMVGTGSDDVPEHKARFLNACNRAREMGMTVWVIALDVQGGGPEDIESCASGEGHFFISDGSEGDLDEVFTRIGKGIGRLRLTL